MDYYDCDGKILRIGDTVQFFNGHYYKCINTLYGIGLKCLSIKLPVILIERISVDHILCSAKKHK